MLTNANRTGDEIADDYKEIIEKIAPKKDPTRDFTNLKQKLAVDFEHLNRAKSRHAKTLNKMKELCIHPREALQTRSYAQDDDDGYGRWWKYTTYSLNCTLCNTRLHDDSFFCLLEENGGPWKK